MGSMMKVAEAVTDTLYDRKGFDDWWDELTEQDRREIQADIAETIEKGL